MTEAKLCLEWYQQGGNASTPAPKLCIILLTYLRTEMAVRTLKGIGANLDYPRELTNIYIADDGSPSEHIEALLHAIREEELTLAGYHSQKFVPGPYPGIGYNQAVRRAHGISDFIMILEDDWVLPKPLDIRPYMWALMENDHVGMIRLSGLVVGNMLKVQAHRGTHYFEYLRSANFCYSGNPHIRHLRFDQTYGLFAADMTPGDMEVHYDNKFHQITDGPAIWRPAELNPWGPFQHIGEKRTW